MEERTVSRVEDWDAQSFPGGYDTLRQLSDGGFSGAVRTRSGTWAFLLNGRVIGVFEGTIEDFDEEDGTVHEAPHPSLPLLFTMLELGGEQQAKYYTNDTPISEAHRQLSDASFTGFIELSENVLSGDYYVVYYGGRSMSCAFVGNAERLFTGDEAFERADDEVGIYEVRTVDVEVVEIPESSTGPADGQPDGEPTNVQPDETPTDVQPDGESTGAGGHRERSPGQPDATSQQPDQQAGTDPRTADRRRDAGGAEQPADRASTGQSSTDRQPADSGQSPADRSPADAGRPSADQPSAGAGHSPTEPGSAEGQGDPANAAPGDQAPSDGTGAAADGPPREPSGAGREAAGSRDEPATEPQESDGTARGGAAGEPTSDADRGAGRSTEGASADATEPATDEARRGAGDDHRAGQADASGTADARTSADQGAGGRRQEPPGDQHPDSAGGGQRQGDQRGGTSTGSGRQDSQAGDQHRESAGGANDHDPSGGASAGGANTGEPSASGAGGEPSASGGNAGGGAQRRDPSGGAGGEPSAGDTGSGPNASGAGPSAGSAGGHERAGGQGTSEGGSAAASPTPVAAERFESTRQVPSLDPDRTGVEEAGGSTAAAAGSAGGQAAGGSTTGGAETADSGDATTGSADAASATTTGSSQGSAGSRSPEEATGGAVRSTEDDQTGGEAVDAAVAAEASSGDLRAELAEREERIEDLEAQLADLQVQRDGLRDERDRLREEVEDLEAEIADLEEEVEDLRSQLNDGIEGKRRLDPEEALRGTNLFVRYGSKSGGTLEKAHAGDVGKEEVGNNLRLEYHTQFDAADVAVDGEPYEQFLEGSLYKEFVDWLVHDLLYEIRGTGHVKGLKDLYDALPQVDRAELLGQVAVEYTEDGEQYREQRTFDVVMRDRMGNPLAVADINDSRNPATREMMTGVIENASDVKGSNDSLASALLVTASFFEPGALEAADEAAGGGLLGGSSRESFVRLSRKRGYHLLLVETRSGEFHVNVPEL